MTDPNSNTPAVAVERVVQFFENITVADLENLGRIYDAQARFTDPFSDVQGLPAIRDAYAPMFEALVGPRFVIRERVQQGLQCFLVWEFHFHFKNFQPEKAQCVQGTSHLVFSAQGLITVHRDYWNAAELYEKLPVVGSLMRWLKKKMQA